MKLQLDRMFSKENMFIWSSCKVLYQIATMSGTKHNLSENNGTTATSDNAN